MDERWNWDQSHTESWGSGQASWAPEAQTAPSSHDESEAAQGNRALHGGVYKLVVGAWLWLLLVFWTVFGFERESAYMMAVTTGLFFLYFGISAMLMGMQRDYETVHERFTRYLQQRFETQSGPISGWGSLVQVAIIPVALALAGTVIGLIIVLARNGALG
ncbi:hypothetical protein ACFOW6_13610 [Fodinicurvata halophila]|uniref:Uncharacterized protein n=1 Tax=Fodinicurvata halophila TaxID=1419723 RepID=A0ABV8UMS8_9PROT